MIIYTILSTIIMFLIAFTLEHKGSITRWIAKIGLLFLGIFGVVCVVIEKPVMKIDDTMAMIFIFILYTGIVSFIRFAMEPQYD